jgi:restriction system protein
MSQKPLPTYKDLLWPTLKALELKGGSASNEELSESVAHLMNLPNDVLDVTHNDGPLSEVDYRAAWARTHLKMIGAANNSARGIWSITEVGRKISSDEQLRKLVKQTKSEIRKTRRKKRAEVTDESDDDNVDEIGWEEKLLTILKGLEPSAFERLCQRLLRESGFSKVEVTGKSGDGGIDGTGVLRVNLLSFHVRFQSKRYSGSVGAGEIRDFRGAMVGRGDKGIFITTGRFTKDAEHEAVRDGAPAIDLIDGLEPCRILKNLGLGVRIESVEQVHVHAEFFESI